MAKTQRAKKGLSAGLFQTVIFLLTLLFTMGIPFTSGAEGPATEPFFREDFNTLKRWEPLKFRKIENMGTYTLDPQSNGECYVRARSSNSASGMIWLGEFDVYEYPVIRWRWKISNVYIKGNASKKEGDDYPMRIYVMFKYDPKDPRVKKRFKYGLAKLLYGKYPPYTSLNYMWANRVHQQRFIPNPFAKESMMVPLRSGSALAGRWLEEEQNILEDYREAFGVDPPAKAGLAFMNDSDNTGESSESWLDWIEISRPSENLEGKGESGKAKNGLKP